MQHRTNGTGVTPFAWIWASPFAQHCARTLYYLAILSGLLLLYGRGDFSTTGFIYQAF